MKSDQLTRQRKFKIPDYQALETPILIPSFSSKGFPELEQIMAVAQKHITEEILVSLYDLYKEDKTPKLDPTQLGFANVVFLDSGGYETNNYTEFSEIYHLPHATVNWTEKQYANAVKAWSKIKNTPPAVLVNYDHADLRFPLKEQIARAESFFKQHPTLAKEFLIKPETKAQYLQIDGITKHIRSLEDFDVIGVTEKELGNSFKERMINIAKIRRALTRAGMEHPIHVFGCLDPVSTPLYYIAGADIFDGLTWLRFIFKDGWPIYKHIGLLSDGEVGLKNTDIGPRLINNNLGYMARLQENMYRYAHTQNISEFQYHQDLLGRAKGVLEATLGKEG